MSYIRRKSKTKGVIMVVKMTSKGQLVIPKKIRQALDLKPGAAFEVELDKGQIVLKPVKSKADIDQTISELQALAGGANLLDDLEAERRWEIERDERRFKLEVLTRND
jgi:AbrB family looped-hinge helix DNA binding protein